MPGVDISDIVGGLYAASSVGVDWSEPGRHLFNHLGVDSGSLRIIQSDGSSVNFFRPNEPVETAYTNTFAAIDPIRASANHMAPRGCDWSMAVKSTEELVPKEIYLRSDFYQNFARPNGQRHYLVGAIGDENRTLVSVFRGARPFNEDERQFLIRLMPHFQRAVQLFTRLNKTEFEAHLGQAAFEALPGGAVVVDGNMRVQFANSAARRLAAGAMAPVALVAEQSRLGHASHHLTLRDRRHANRLRTLVADAATGGSGGALRLEADDVEGEARQLALVVAPQPISERARLSLARPTTPVLILINELSRPAAPPASLLGDLFGLSIAERAVAVALLGGQTAETVASKRDVSLDTVRSQIRTVLRKSGAANLRDFERIGATLAALRR